MSIPLAHRRSHVRPVPETDIVAEHVTPTRSRLYVQYRDGGPSAMFSLAGKPMGELPVENNSDIAIGEVLNGDDVMVRIELSDASYAVRLQQKQPPATDPAQ